MIKEKIEKLVKETIKELWGTKIKTPDISVKVEKSPSGFGDYAVNTAFSLAKSLQANPSDVASQLTKKLNDKKPQEIAKIEAVGGYINFYLSENFLRNELTKIYKNRRSYGQSKIGQGKKVIIEYSSPNIAKPMHVGHLRSTIIGDALANVYKALGYKVIRWNYLGDWGTQFGKLIAAYKLWGNKNEIEKNPIKTLESLYVRFHKELKNNPELEQKGREEFQKLEEGDKENRRLWKWFKKESLKEFNRIYRLLGVKFDVEIGESAYEKDLTLTIADLKKRGIAQMGEGGSVIIKLEKYNLPPALIQKSDGASLYITRDIALLKDRIKKYKPEKILYVVANQQTLHFQQLFAIAQMLGLTPLEIARPESPSGAQARARFLTGLTGVKLEHIKFGLVLGEGKKKFSTREGNAITLEEVVNKAIELAREIVKNKSAERGMSLSEKEKEKIAQTVAIGALKYQDLKEHRNLDIVFDWKKMLDFTGSSGPYLQYTYARLLSILKKAKTSKKGHKLLKSDFNNLGEKSELAVIKHLLEFPDVLKEVGETNLPNCLALYLYELANLVNQFYETVPVIKDENTNRRAARLALVETAAAVLKTGLELLGIGVLEKI
jgi:arginyl-tRNA synthetase